MIKAEMTELKKLLTQKNCSITRICGCYVDGDKNKVATFSRSFLALPEEEMFKYFEILRKALSGTPGKNAVDMAFLPESEEEGGSQDFLLKLRASGLKDEGLVDEFFNRIISTYNYVGNYLILVVHDAYDVPGKSTDGEEMVDASDEVYDYLLTVICPVNLSDPGLSYDPVTNEFHNRNRDWIVELPMNGFLFPAFTDRTTDIHNILYYSKDAENLGDEFIEMMLGCTHALTAGGQKETFQALVEETLGDDCGFEAVKTIHEKMSELIEDHKEEVQPLVMDKTDVKKLFEGSGVANDRLADFDRHYQVAAGPETPLMVSNVYNTRSFDVKTPDVTIKVKPDRTDLIDERTIDGRPCVVVELNGEVEVNGINVKAHRKAPSDTEVEE
jgi:hypothetical protein